VPPPLRTSSRQPPWSALPSDGSSGAGTASATAASSALGLAGSAVVALLSAAAAAAAVPDGSADDADDAAARARHTHDSNTADDTRESREGWCQCPLVLRMQAPALRRRGQWAHTSCRDQLLWHRFHGQQILARTGVSSSQVNLRPTTQDSPHK
jgi:hypothetical protein